MECKTISTTPQWHDHLFCHQEKPRRGRGWAVCTFQDCVWTVDPGSSEILKSGNLVEFQGFTSWIVGLFSKWYDEASDALATHAILSDLFNSTWNCCSHFFKPHVQISQNHVSVYFHPTTSLAKQSETSGESFPKSSSANSRNFPLIPLCMHRLSPNRNASSLEGGHVVHWHQLVEYGV